jgi:hypothetical protein
MMDDGACLNCNFGYLGSWEFLESVGRVISAGRREGMWAVVDLRNERQKSNAVKSFKDMDGNLSNYLDCESDINYSTAVVFCSKRFRVLFIA